MTRWVGRLLALNVAVYFLQVMQPRFGGTLAFVPALALLRPWTILTYMFVHGGLTHILFNMLGLFFFGPRVEERLGESRFLQLYLVSGISGAILSAILAPNAAIIGASGAVFGVMLSFAWFWPDTPIYIWGVLPVPARVLVIVTTLLALFSGLQGSRGGVADFAHLGGYAGAFLYLKWLGRKRDEWKRKAVAPTAKVNATIGRWRAIDTRGIHEVNREEVNRLLDKISASGVNSLTAQERTFLSNFVPPDDRPRPPNT